MKNNYSIAAILLLGVIFFTPSCKKKIETCKLGKFYLSDGHNTPNPNTFYYYEDGRLQKITYSNLTTDTILYHADSIEIWNYDDIGTLTSKFVGVLNSGGYVLNGTQTAYNNVGAPGNVDQYFCDYNPDGNLTLQTITTSSGVTVYKFDYLGGNRSKGVITTTADTSYYTFYHGTAENKTGQDELNEPFTPYFGKPSKNLLDSVNVIVSGDTARIRYTHELDRNDYVTKTVRTYIDLSSPTTFFSYSYFDCKE